MADLSIEQLQETRIVIEAKGVANLAAYADLRLLDSELEQGVQALYSDEAETIVAFVFSRGSFTDETAREWVTQAESAGVNLSVRTGLDRAPSRPSFILAGGAPVAAAVDDLSFEDVRGLLSEAIESSEVTMSDGSYRWPWLVDVYVDYCVISLGARYYRVPYTIDEQNAVLFGELQEVTRTWEPVAQSDEDISVAADMGGSPRVFNLMLRDPVSLPADISEDDGLLWKEIFRVSTTFRPGTGAPLVVDQAMIDAIYGSFEARVLNNVAITASTHHEETDGIVPADDTVGFVERLIKAGEQLYAGLDVRDADIRDKLDQGLIRDCSVYVWADFYDRSVPDTVWPWALVHLLLTNYPQLPDLQGFGAAPEAVAASFSGVQFTQYREDPMSEGTNQVQTPALSPEDQALLDQAKALQAQGFTLDGAVERQAQMRTKARGLEVDSILAALEGQGQRDDVVVIKGTRHYPAVVQAVETALRPEQMAFDISDDGISPVDSIVLAIVNALPKEARFALNVSARTNRAMAGMAESGQGQRHRTTPIDPSVIRDLPEEAIEQLDQSLGG